MLYHTPRQQGLKRALPVVAALAALLVLSPAARAQQVFIGSGNGWQQLSAHPEQWEFVRGHADGFYINFIELLHTDAAAFSKLSPLFAHRNAYYELDSRYTGLGGFPDGGQFSRALQAKELGCLLDGGFRVPYTSLNYGLDADKEADLKSQGLPAGTSRPCFTQIGPWELGGDILSDAKDNAGIRANIARSDGLSTDGPLSLWQADQGKMRSGSFSVVKYVHRLHKTTAVMVAPYNLKPRSLWLNAAQQCVRQHEDAGAKPDIWIVFEYATDTPTLPETVNGQPADTITGMAYWLIHHLKDPKHWAHLTTPDTERTPDGSVTRLTLRNDSARMDLCPVLLARVRDPLHDWNARFMVSGRDVTRQVTQEGGLPFVGGLRLWPGDARPVRVVLTPRSSAARAGRAALATVQMSLQPNPSAQDCINQKVTLWPVLERPAARVAFARNSRPNSLSRHQISASCL